MALSEMRPFGLIGRIGPIFFALCATAAADQAGALDFFEKQIRPVLVEQCYECHGEKSQKGGLRLDTKAGWEKGGDSGPTIVPGNPDKSLLIQAIRYHDKDLAMPPKKSGGKMPDDQIANFEAWVKIGAPDPRTGGPSTAARDMAKAKEHWAFKPVAAPPVPQVKTPAWVKTPVDAFILANLEAKALKPAPPAEKRTLIRRVYLDLTGLPPSPEEVDAFNADQSPDAFAKVVDHLLDSPHYGERWGRYWLDIARYADTRGYLAGGEERRFPFSFTYRDYVVRAINEDKPFDQFIREQLAADKLVSGEDQSALAALGFLTLGRSGPPQDMIDDRIDVVTRGLMALTVSCARCHDHKFDPVPTADYYSFYSVFASSQEPPEKPLLTTKIRTGPEYDDFLKKRAEVEAKVQAKADETIAEFLSKERRKLGDYLLGAHEAKRAGAALKLDTFAGERKIAGPILDRWMRYFDDPASKNEPVVAPWFAFAALGEKDFAPRAKELAAKLAANADPAKPVNPALAKAFEKAAPASLKEVAAIYNTLAVRLEDAWKAAETGAKKENKPAPKTLPDAKDESVRAFLVSERSPNQLPREIAETTIRRELNNRTVPIRRELGALDWSHPGAPLRAMALVDRDKPNTQRIFLRGNPGSPGPIVPRQFLEVIAGPQRKPFAEGSGRLDLAKAIAARDNPLTARVFVNRVWGWHFGRPFVSTPGDFGVRTEAPVQRALLDWLAAQFMDQGWSLKKLHRLILLSSTYQQSDFLVPQASSVDPENTLHHHFKLRRLDFEAMRDTILACAGKLDLTVGGLPVDIWKVPFSPRRTVYGFIDRLNLPAVFRTFDFANPDITSPQRFTTTVPQQALFMMNSPFVIEQAQALIQRPEVAQMKNDTGRLSALYRLLYQRAPSADEVKDAVAFLKKQLTPAIEPGWHYGWGWYDPLVNHTKDFHAFAFVSKDRRSPQAKMPTPQHGFASIRPDGGHPGSLLQTSTVLRWVSPVDGKVNIVGSLEHSAKAGDGVRGLIVSGRGGKLGEWTVLTSKAATNLPGIEVKLGEAIDFIVECRTGDNSDGYSWAPKVMLIGDYKLELPKRSWDARADFAPQRKLAPLTAWETLAQAMLVSNELMFIE